MAPASAQRARETGASATASSDSVSCRICRSMDEYDTSALETARIAGGGKHSGRTRPSAWITARRNALRPRVAGPRAESRAAASTSGFRILCARARGLAI